MKTYYGHEILNDFSKEEIIEFLRRNFFSESFRRSEMLYIRWDLQSKSNLEKSKKLIEERKRIDTNTIEGHKKWLEVIRLEMKLQEKFEKICKILEESHKAREEEEKS